MTDATVRSATATFAGQQFNVEVRITCNPTAAFPYLIAYTVSSFDQGGRPAEMRREQTLVRTYQTLQARADADNPQAVTQGNPRYNNQITIDVQPVLGEQPGSANYMIPVSVRLARASRVTLRLFLLSGDETIEFSQQNPNLRSVLDPCLAELDRVVAERRAAQRGGSGQPSQAQPDNGLNQGNELRPAPASAEDMGREPQANPERQSGGQRSEQQVAEELQRFRRQDEERDRQRRQAFEDQAGDEEQRQRQEQAALCAQIRRSGTTNPDYLRMQGCRP